MENYLSIREASEKWGVSERRINQYCAEGRIPGAQRFGKSWAIPDDAEKPGDPRRTRQQAEPAPAQTAAGLLDHTNLMPLMNTAFAPGRCREAVEAMAAGPQRDIAMAEYHYFSGQPEAAAKEAEPYLTSPDMGVEAFLLPDLRLFQSIHRPDPTGQGRFGGAERLPVRRRGEQSPQFRAASAFIASTGAVLLHLPLPEEMPEVESFLPLLPPGLRAFALYVQAHYLYLKEEVRTQRWHCGGHPCHGRGKLPHPRHLPASGGGHGLYEPQTAGSG